MRFSKPIIFFLNRDSYSKRIYLLFLYYWTIHIHKNSFLILSRRRAWKTNDKCSYPSLRRRESRKPLSNQVHNLKRNRNFIFQQRILRKIIIKKLTFHENLFS